MILRYKYDKEKEPGFSTLAGKAEPFVFQNHKINSFELQFEIHHSQRNRFLGLFKYFETTEHDQIMLHMRLHEHTKKKITNERVGGIVSNTMGVTGCKAATIGRLECPMGLSAKLH